MISSRKVNVAFILIFIRLCMYISYAGYILTEIHAKSCLSDAHHTISPATLPLQSIWMSIQ